MSNNVVVPYKSREQQTKGNKIMATQVIFTNTNLEDEIKIIKALEAKEKEMKELRKEKEANIKKLMDNAGVSELKVAGFTIRYTKFTKFQFDTDKFKTAYKNIYQDFLKSVNSSKFTIA